MIDRPTPPRSQGRRRPLLWAIVAALAVLWLGAGPAAHAGRMTYKFTGTVVQQEGVDGVVEGDLIEGFLSYDPGEMARQESQPDDPATYYTGDVTLSFRAGPHLFEIPVPYSTAAFIEDGRDGEGELPGDNLGFVVGAEPDHVLHGGPLLMSLGLIDESGTAFDGDELPLSIDFAKFSAGVVLAFDEESSLSGVIESFEAVTVPEPAPVALLFAGFAWIAGRRWRRRRTAARD